MIRILMLLTLLCESAIAGPATQPGQPSNAAGDEVPMATVVHTYDVHALVQQTADYPLTPSMLPTLPGATDQATEPPANSVVSSAEHERALLSLIETTIDPGTWKDEGGTICSATIFDGRLVVNNTQAVQSQIQSLVETLTSDAARTVKVNAKWILLSSDEQKALTAKSSKDANAITVIGDAELESSKLYCEGQTLGLSGQTVHVSCGQEQAYVSNVTPIVGAGVAAYEPTMSTVRSGVALQVTPTLAGNSVLLDLRSIVGNVGNITSGPVQVRASFEPTTVPSDSGLVQRPKIEGQQFHTTVRLPLGENVLIGGMSRVPGDEEPSLSQLFLVIRVDASR